MFLKKLETDFRTYEHSFFKITEYLSATLRPLTFFFHETIMFILSLNDNTTLFRFNFFKHRCDTGRCIPIGKCLTKIRKSSVRRLLVVVLARGEDITLGGDGAGR